MDQLVKLSDQSINGVPYTTADVIAEYAGISHKSINKMVNKQKERLERFGSLRFKIAAVKHSKGYSNKRVYLLNEQQATLLITFLKNTERVAEFKERLVASFYKLKTQQTQRQMMRDFSKEISKQLSDAIKNNVENTKSYTYSNFNRLVYKSALGMTTSQLKKLRNIRHSDEISTYLTIDEFKKVNQTKVKLVGLLNQELSYQEIKEQMTPQEKVIRLETV